MRHCILAQIRSLHEMPLNATLYSRMNRREFSKSFLLHMLMGPIVGCSEQNEKKRHMSINIPQFSKQNLHRQLDLLATAYEEKGLKVKQTMLPGIPEAELRKKCSWFPGELPEEIIALYEWSGGQVKDDWDVEYPFWFRDNVFSRIDRAKVEYSSMMSSYGSYPEDHEMLKYSFPFAAFNGSVYVLPTKGHNLNSVLNKPIVNVFQGIDIFFYSIERMVETCVDWVRNDMYSYDGVFPEKVEQEIWQKHNPGVFSAQI